MGVIGMGGILIHGNFEEVKKEKQKDFHYDRDEKWIEPYSFDWREVLGNAICSCTNIEVHFQPYYGYDFYHQPKCSLIRKLEAEPQIHNLREVYLPQLGKYDDCIENDGKRHIWVENKSKRLKKVKVNIRSKVVSNNLSLLGV